MSQSNRASSKKTVGRSTEPPNRNNNKILTKNIDRENERKSIENPVKRQYEKVLPGLLEDTDDESNSTDSDTDSSTDDGTDQDNNTTHSTIDIAANKKLSEEIDKQTIEDAEENRNYIKENISYKADTKEEEIMKINTTSRPKVEKTHNIDGDKTVDIIRQNRRLNIKVSNDAIYFNTRNKKFSFMSNFYPSKLLIDGKEYWHVEGYYQSQKFAEINKSAEDHIRTALSPALCKKVAYSYPLPPSRKKEWDEGLKDKIMKRGVLCKFITDKYLTESLISTGDTMLIEDNIYDEYWANGTGGRGLNKLGDILMNVRNVLNQMN